MELVDIVDAQNKLSHFIRETKLFKTSLSKNCNLYIKPENLQLTGSFKIRGAFNKILNLSEEEKSHGVVACSAGNHAQGVAMASKIAGVKAVVCMPKSAPLVKINSTKDLGAEVVLVDGVYDDAYEKALELQEECGYTFVHPFNDEKVIAGQGTIALEILNELPNTDAIVCAVGGGGLISGIAYAAKMLKPDIKIYGIQSSGAPGMYASLASGYVTKLKKVNTFADGIAVKEVGNLTYDFNQNYVDDILTVTDEDILEAIKKMLTKEKILSEGAGAASVAAVIKGHIPDLKDSDNVVCVVSGGNIDLDTLSKIVLEGLD